MTTSTAPTDRLASWIQRPLSGSRGSSWTPTAYAGDQLLLRPTGDDDRVVKMLTQAADEQDYDAELEPVDRELAELADEAGILRGGDQPLVVRVRLHRRYGERALPAADAWPVLQRYRELAGNDPRRYAVQLEHLLTTAAKGVRPAPYVAHAMDANPYVAMGSARTRTSRMRSARTRTWRMRSARTRMSPIPTLLMGGLTRTHRSPPPRMRSTPSPAGEAGCPSSGSGPGLLVAAIASWAVPAGPSWLSSTPERACIPG